MIYGFCLINMIMRAACDCFASVTQNFYTENYECLFIYFGFFGEMLFIQLAACDKTDYSFSVLCNLNTGIHEYIIICRACFNADLPWKNIFQAWNNRKYNGSNENWFFVCNSRFYDIDGPAHSSREFDVFFMFKSNDIFYEPKLTASIAFANLFFLNTPFNCTPEPYR